MKPKRKYLYVEIDRGALYIYGSDMLHKRSQTLTLDMLDNECMIAEFTGKSTKVRVKIPVKELYEPPN